MTDAPRILFLADFGARVGGGHVMRCLALAGALIADGAQCAFAATAEVAAVLDAFAPPGVQRLAVPGGKPAALAAQAAEAARAWGAQAAVIDHYGAGLDEERVLREAVGGLLAIDDLGRAHDADLVLDSNLERSAADYPGLEVLAGPAFALVRPEFARLRDATLAARAQNPAVRHVLLSLGLTDPGGFTSRVAEALLPELGDVVLDVAVGRIAPILPVLVTLVARCANLRLHVETPAMALLIAQADIAVGGGGSSLWERCVLGAPSVTVVLAENQGWNTTAAAAAGATVALDANAGDFIPRLSDSFIRLRDDAELRAGVSRAAAALCDGLGAERVAEQVLALV